MHTETPLIRNAARQMVRELHLLDGRDAGGLSLSACHLLTELDSMQEATATELSEVLVLEKSTISRLCKRLLAKGLLAASTGTHDRRQRLLQLSPAGKKAAAEIHKAAKRQVNAALAFVTEAQRPKLADALQRYAKALRYARLAEQFQVRPIRKTDNPAVARIIREVMTEFGAVGEGYSINDAEIDDMYSAYPAPRSKFWVITLQGKVLGCGGIGPLQDDEENTCELRKMYFRTELRGTGMGTHLLNLCLNEARRIGYRQCYLETIEAMAHARKLYRAQGFTQLNRPMGATGHTSCNAWMVKAL